jgi:hypothetical protein
VAKDILIRQTLDATAADRDEDYDQESDGGDTLMNEVGESMDSLEILHGRISIFRRVTRLSTRIRQRDIGIIFNPRDRNN